MTAARHCRLHGPGLGLQAKTADIKLPFNDPSGYRPAVELMVQEEQKLQGRIIGHVGGRDPASADRALGLDMALRSLAQEDMKAVQEFFPTCVAAPAD